VDSGKLKLGDEKRALQEITNTRRLRRTIEGFQAEQAAIDREKEQEEELRAQLDDPETKAISERYEKLKAEFDNLKRESDETAANRDKLFDHRNALQGEMDTLWSLKKESQQRFRDANDR
jgi:molecular chaperone GrpE (heat shock protein)